MPDPKTLSTEDLAAAYEFQCALSAQLYAQGADDSAAEAACDLLAAELMDRGIL
jgi:hypothetical protein